MTSANLDLTGFDYRYLVPHSDIDDSGVMHFSRYPALVETALLQGLRTAGWGLAELRAHGCQLVVAQLQVSYRSPARLLDELVVRAWPEHIGGVQLRVGGLISAAGERLVELSMVLGVLDPRTERPTRLPAALRGMLTGLLPTPDLEGV
ncbi:acyl-CoA thioesterase [Jatrophihabitans sp.]|uniref:acyl-CoA thioesterase n=1 Tax=Jatrophihabitans sp. TaxID=1932789 RepID=UPI002EF9979F